jgi:hypothetical protein
VQERRQLAEAQAEVQSQLAAARSQLLALQVEVAAQDSRAAAAREQAQQQEALLREMAQQADEQEAALQAQWAEVRAAQEQVEQVRAWLPLLSCCASCTSCILWACDSLSPDGLLLCHCSGSWNERGWNQHITLCCAMQEQQELQHFGSTLQQQSQELAAARQQLVELQAKLQRQQREQQEAAAALQVQASQLAAQQRTSAELRRSLDRERLQLAEERSALLAERSASCRAADRAREAQMQLNEAVRAHIVQGVPISLRFEGEAGDVPVVTLLEGQAGSPVMLSRGRHSRSADVSGPGRSTEGGALAQLLEAAGLAPEHMQRQGKERSAYLQEQQQLLLRFRSSSGTGGGAGPVGSRSTGGAPAAPPLVAIPSDTLAPLLRRSRQVSAAGAVHQDHSAAQQPQRRRHSSQQPSGPPPRELTTSPPSSTSDFPQRGPAERLLLCGGSLTSLLPLSCSTSEAEVEEAGGRGGAQQQAWAASRPAAAGGAGEPGSNPAGLLRGCLDGGSSLTTVAESGLEGLEVMSSESD